MYKQHKQLHLGPDSQCPPLTPGKLRIYSMRFCPFAQRARIVLAHKEIDHELINVNLKDKPKWFTDMNPGGQVPFLELDDIQLAESTAVSEWLDDTYPKNKLIPSDPTRKALDRMELEYMSKVNSSMGVAYTSEDKDKILSAFQPHFQHYDEVLAKRGGTYFGGDKLAMIDIYIWTVIHFLRMGVEMKFPGDLISKEEFPNFRGWYDVMKETPAVKACTLDDEMYHHFIPTLLQGNPDYDYKLR